MSPVKVGAIFKTAHGDLEVLSYVGDNKFLVKFLQTDFTTEAWRSHIIKGLVKDKLNTSFSSMGYIGDGPHNSKTDAKAYMHWTAMLARCYGGGVKAYDGCSVEHTWHNFQAFASWCRQQEGFGNSGWHLDKDLLIVGNKIYGPTSCCFVPREVNGFLVKQESLVHDLPTGVRKSGGKFCAQMGTSLKEKHIGTYNSAEDAFFAYKLAKEAKAKRLAESYKGQIDNRAYEALLNYEVEMAD